MAAQDMALAVEEATMTDPEPAMFDEDEFSKVLSLLPPYEGKSILELGSGVGRFTSELAKKAGQVLVFDVTERATQKSESIDEQPKNVKLMTSSAIDISSNSVDMIFAYQLLMHLSDQQVENLAERMVKWLKPGGFIFFSETCVDPSEAHKLNSNTNIYREPRFYTKVFKECTAQDESGNSHELSLICCKCIGPDARNKDQNQICWIWQKVDFKDDKGFQQFLDTVQYKWKDILRYERVFGPGFVSPGGIETTREFVSKLGLKPRQQVLDVGCGIGGVDFYMAENFGVEVVGIDLSVNMISLALERSVRIKSLVRFEVADCTKKAYPDKTFDVIYSRDTILHVQDKPALFRSFYKWLKPGGKVLITDYCKSAGPPSPEFAAYIKKRGYDLHDVQAYGQMLKDAGFDEVIAEDRTDQFIEILQKELGAVEKDKDGFIKDFSEEDYEDIIGGWKAKLVRSTSGEQRWGLFIAEKKLKD